MSQPPNPASYTQRLGVCEWFHHNDHEHVLAARDRLRGLGVARLRTGVSWADFHRPDGPAFVSFLFEELQEFELLPSVWHTPPSISRNGACSGPPHDLRDYAAFIGQIIDLHGDRFHEIELWNEPNGRFYWDFLGSDPQWHLFGEMIHGAAAVAASAGKPAVLGGLAPADPTFITLLRERGHLEHVPIVGVHGFPHMWGEHFVDDAGGSERAAAGELPADGWDQPWRWSGWADRIAAFEEVAGGRAVWVTETGLSTWDAAAGRAGTPGALAAQSAALEAAAAAPSPRVYWYGLDDLDPGRASIEGDHADEHAYHFGVYGFDGSPKPAASVLSGLLAGGGTR
ncbi:hypothetical protein [Phycisphaera mikurensis]|uniref:Glycoside hydrolase family 5 domain-containing protein n=1 Tax=Phycisphaera mikurensis (strain NBRC 102666 / KCTC 22515 / FYK2301M01) TaxID=1142394 RepID=I0IIN7_PHYMF|nr:hypothetical protein [Phycisphaera mikurensis]MBB6442723.1 CDP-paratose 2-epimerase [Phycisphaera mikurensis]BAM05125.1 hypothetical protein PSMK_29660 [Phycisphaera mikurensis NBRC 102666]